MKTLAMLVCGLLLLGMSAPVTAQHEIGIIAGLNLAKLHHEGSAMEARGHEFSHLTRFGVGAIIDLSLTRHFGFRFEPMYLQKGAKGGAVLVSESKIKIDYLEIPTFLKYAFGRRAVRPYMMLGPSFGFRLSDDRTNSGSQQIKAIDLGIGFGVGVSISTAKGNFFLEATHTHGAINIDKGESNAGEDNNTVTDDSRFMTGISFPFGKKE